MSNTLVLPSPLDLDSRVKNFVAPYINNFKRYISNKLKPDVGLGYTVIPYDNGTLLRFEFVENTLPENTKKSAENLHEAMIKGNLELLDKNGKKINTITLKGTNIFLNGNKIFIIKDNDVSEWTDDKAKKDVEKIIAG